MGGVRDPTVDVVSEEYDRATGSSPSGIYLNKWAVHIEGDAGHADDIAREHGFINNGQVGQTYFKSYFVSLHYICFKK